MNSMAKVELVIIGDEIIFGEIIDTNSRYLSKRLFGLGFEVFKITTIGDSREAIEDVLKSGLKRTGIVISSGGLGPTPDDNTRYAAAKIYERRLILDENVLKRIEEEFKKRPEPMPEIATKQAMIPQGSIVLENPIGLAPGIILTQEKETLILLPGVPEELKKIFETGVIPYLEANYQKKPVIHRIIRTTNITEGEIFERIKDISKKNKKIRFAYLPHSTGVDLRIGIEDSDKKELSSVEKEITLRLKQWVYGYNSTEIEEVVGGYLRKKGLTLSVAESCTGGLLQDRITNVPGSSESFIGGIIAYSNEIKRMICGVKDETLKRFGAVSKEVVLEMAEGVKTHFKTDIGIAISGIAGPTGGTSKKPVGLVYFGIADKKGRKYEERIFTGTRRLIKEKAAMAALDLLRRTLISL